MIFLPQWFAKILEHIKRAIKIFKKLFFIGGTNESSIISWWFWD